MVFFGVLLLSACTTIPGPQCVTHLADAPRDGSGRIVMDGDHPSIFAFQSCRAASGDKSALLWMGEQFEKGSSLIEVNYKKAFQLYEQAATDDPTRTSIYVPGINGAPGRVMSFDNPSAKPGLAEAKYRLGLMYAEGRGVVQSTKKAVRWMERAARMGHPAARMWLVRFRKKEREQEPGKPGAVDI